MGNAINRYSFDDEEKARIEYSQKTGSYAMKISVDFTDADVRECMSHLKGVTACIALENIDSLLQSYVYEAGCEIMSQLLRDEGWDIGGKSFIEMGGW